jgi:protein BCP1
MVVKRKTEEQNQDPSSSEAESTVASSEASQVENEELNPEDREIVDVDFDFFDPKEIDFHAIKRLLQQVFGPESEKVLLSELADLIIAQPHIGSCVKTDGDENSDPYAFITTISLKEHPVSII